MKETISVIIPVYNTEKYLKKCVDSVLAQSYKNLEIILVDDGSTDNSGKICDEYANMDERVKVIHKKNGGLSSARNTGLDIASGNYIGFLDSDDYISPEMYEQMVSKVEEDYVVCNLFVRINEFGNVFPKNDYHKEGGKTTEIEYLRELLMHIGDVSVCTKLFSKVMIGKLRFDEKRLNEDLLFMLSLIPRMSGIIYTGHIGYYYLTRSESISSKYGKSVEDMAINSLVVKEFVQAKYPMLEKEAMRFALYQHMAYLLMIPKQKAVRDNELYINSVRYLRKNFLKKGIQNPYLSIKNKFILFGETIAPRFMAYIYQRKSVS